jgi:HD-GYP domain-containing protein (c-di-GMP phosphodiesterase class II)
MTISQNPLSQSDFHTTFAKRCARLGIPCWGINVESNSLTEPDEPAALVPLLRCTVVRSMIQNAAAAMMQAEQPAILKPLPGWIVAPFVQSDGFRKVSLSVALLLSDSVCESAQFSTACMSASLDPAKLRTVCQPLLRRGGAEIENTLSVLGWMHEDLLRNHRNEHAIEQLHEQLARPTIGAHDGVAIGIVGALVSAIEAKDPYAVGHAQRVSILAAMMARTLNLDEREIETYRVAGLVHDIGKIGIPESILTKQGTLSAAEIALVQHHAEIGHKILKEVPSLEAVLPGVLHHHERFDGFGYPKGLAGEHVPLIARVLALADTFDAMSSDRSYRSGMPRENVIEEITRCTGTQFDPKLVELFLALDFTAIDQQLTRHKQRQAA